MFSIFSKGFAGFPPWCIGFTILYMFFYMSWILDYRRKYIYPLEQVTYSNINPNPATDSCHDPLHFIYPCPHYYFSQLGIRLHKAMIHSQGFKNTSCLNITGFDLPNKNKAYCAKHNNKLHSNKFCNGGYIIWANNPQIVSQLSKSTMNKMLTKYCNVYHKSDNVCNFKLLSYNMDNLQQRIEFITKHLDCTNNNAQPDKTWLFKEDKHEGNGVHFYNNHKLIYSLLGPSQIEEQKYYNKCANNSTLQILQTNEYFKKEGLDYVPRNDNSGAYKVNYNKLVMQEFVSNPLLIENRAFHIRTLHLVASNRNPLIVLQFPQWNVFRNPLEYDNSELDPLKLRSNWNVAAESMDKIMVNGTIVFKFAWGYNRFQKYLMEKYSALNHTNLENKMQKDMADIATTVFKARSYYNRLSKWGGMNSNKIFPNILRFDFLCMDTVMNDKFELKFLEINFHCGYECKEKWGNQTHFDTVGDDAEWCDAFSNETSNILMEIYEKRKNGIDIESLSSLNKFKLVYLEK